MPNLKAKIDGRNKKYSKTHSLQNKIMQLFENWKLHNEGSLPHWKCFKLR